MWRPRTSPPDGGYVEGRVRVGDRRRQRRASRSSERGRLRNEDHRAKIEPAVGEELYRIGEFGHSEHRATVKGRAHVVAMAFHLPGKGVEIGGGERRCEQMIGGDKPGDQGRGRGAEPSRYRNVRAHVEGERWQSTAGLLCQPVHRG